MQYRKRKQKELKPSGVEWLGDIPKEWIKTNLRNFLKSKIVDGPHETPNYVNKGIPFISVDSLNENENINLNNVKKFISNEQYNIYNKKTKLTKNDLLFTKSATIGKVAIMDDRKFMTWSPIAIIKSDDKKIHYKNLFYILKSNRYIDYIKSLSNLNTQLNIGMGILEKSKIVISNNMKEQQKIANFLDEKSKTFDDVISKKEELITKLENAKQSLISEVVTGKLKVVKKENKLQTIKRKKEELKPSKVDWLGDIPKEWQVKKTKYLFEIKKRIAGILGYDVLSITQKGIKIKDITTGGGQLSMDYSKYQIVNVGDFAMNHMDLLTGFVDISKTQGVTSPDYRVFTLTNNSDLNYYLYLFQMGYRNKIFFAFGQGSSQLGRWRLPTKEFKKFYFPNPSKIEQELISKYLDKKLVHFDNTIENTKQSIEKLKQAKESLISEAVTGKIEIL
nr:restriction endonuclease subunit S [Pseudodesulfovibrio sp.]